MSGSLIFISARLYDFSVRRSCPNCGIGRKCFQFLSFTRRYTLLSLSVIRSELRKLHDARTHMREHVQSSQGCAQACVSSTVGTGAVISRTIPRKDSWSSSSSGLSSVVVQGGKTNLISSPIGDVNNPYFVVGPF